MRRWIVWLLVLLVVCVGFVYLFVPASTVIKEQTGVGVNAKAFARSFFDEASWPAWWPGQKSADGYLYNGTDYRVREKRISSWVISLAHGRDTLPAELIAIPVGYDSIELIWLTAVSAGANPVARLQAYGRTKTISNDVKKLLQAIKAYYTDPAHLYPISISEEEILDSTLISTSVRMMNYPTTENIYSLIDRLKDFAQKNGASQTGLPMLNIMVNTDSSYRLQVALPVDKKLQDEGDIHYRWMLGGGNILAAEVKGGPAKIQQAFAAMQAYMEDHHRSAPAIPFQSLITDRRAEPDSNKWVTKIYWPVRPEK